MYDTLNRVVETGLVTRVLLFGSPGTGKTTWGSNLAKDLGREFLNVTLSRDSTPQDLVGGYMVEGGSTTFHPGPAVQMMKQGGVLSLSEVTDASLDVEPLLLSILDDPKVRAITLPDGTVEAGEENTIIVASCNDSPSTMRPALLDRWDLVVPISEPPEGALELLGDTRNFYREFLSKQPPPDFRREVSFRTLRMFSVLMERDLFDGKDLASMIWGSQGADVLQSIDVAKVDAA